jgi:hypothetical protein
MKYTQRLQEMKKKETQENLYYAYWRITYNVSCYFKENCILRRCMTYVWWNALRHEVRFAMRIFAASCCVNSTICMQKTTEY